VKGAHGACWLTRGPWIRDAIYAHRDVDQCFADEIQGFRVVLRASLRPTTSRRQSATIEHSVPRAVGNLDESS